jgi:hypothetical protein
MLAQGLAHHRAALGAGLDAVVEIERSTMAPGLGAGPGDRRCSAGITGPCPCERPELGAVLAIEGIEPERCSGARSWARVRRCSCAPGSELGCAVADRPGAGRGIERPELGRGPGA